MLKINRRQCLRIAATAATLFSWSSAHSETLESGSRVWLYDRNLVSAKSLPAVEFRPINVAQDRQYQWRQLRQLENAEMVSGVTLWSDFLMIRGHLESQGYRLKDMQQTRGLCFFTFLPRMSSPSEL